LNWAAVSDCPPRFHYLPAPAAGRRQAAACRLIAVSHRAHRFAFDWPSSWLFWTVSDGMNPGLLWIVITTVAAVVTGTVIGCLLGECR
jgi:hypothetical protein